MMKSTRFKDLDSVLDGKVSQSEARNTAQWLATDEGQEYLAKCLDDDFNRLYLEHSPPAICKESEERLLLKIESIINTSSNKIELVKKIGCFVSAAILISFIFYINLFCPFLEKPEYNRVTTLNGEYLQVLFQDGSKAYLYPGSEILYPTFFNLRNRNIQFSGKGYFEIAKKKNTPFNISLDNGTMVKVTGTSFLVDSYSFRDEISVRLDEGSIDFHYDVSKVCSLWPTEEVVFNKKTAAAIKKKSYKATNGFSEKKTHQMKFSNEPLNTILHILEITFDIPFNVIDSTALNYNYTFEFKNPSFDQVIESIERISPVYFTKSDTLRVFMK